MESGLNVLRQPQHHVQIVFGKHGGHQVHLLHAHARARRVMEPPMLSTYCMISLLAFLLFWTCFGVADVEDDQRVQIAVTRMKYVADDYVHTLC